MNKNISWYKTATVLGYCTAVLFAVTGLWGHDPPLIILGISQLYCAVGWHCAMKEADND